MLLTEAHSLIEAVTQPEEEAMTMDTSRQEKKTLALALAPLLESTEMEFPKLEFKSIISMASELLKTKSFNEPVGAVRREAFSRRLVL
jgi:hypothetical protein